MRTSRLLIAIISIASASLSTSAAAFGQVASPAAAPAAVEPTAAPAEAQTAQPAEAQTAQPAEAQTAQPAQAAQAATPEEPVPTYDAVAAVGFGKAGQFAIGAERLFGVSWDSETTTIPLGGGVERKNTVRSTNVSLLSNPNGGGTSAYNFARLAADYFVIDGLSLGGSLGYFRTSGKVKVSEGGVDTETDTGTTSGYLIAARLGYAKMFSELIGVWPRAGLSYIDTSVKDADGNDVAGGGYRAAIGLDVPLVFAPLPHFGFLLGPSLDYGFKGKNDTNAEDANRNPIITGYDTTSLSIALNAGMFVYF